MRVRFLIVASVACWLIAAINSVASEPTVADAAEKRSFESVAQLVANKSDVNQPQADGMTALHWAVHHDHPATVKLLLAAGADVKASNHYGVAPLSLACIRGNTEIVQTLLEAGADPNTALAGGETALMTASRTGLLGPVKSLLAKGADVNAKEHKGQTALMWAAAEGNLEVVDALLAADADFRTPLSSGFTPFFFAVREGKPAVVFRLLQAGIQVNDPMQPERRGGGGRRPTNALLLAVENGHFELAIALVDAGADPNAAPAGFTALHGITWVRKPIRGDPDPPPRGSGSLESLEFVRQLVARGAQINARYEKGASGRGRYTITGSTPFALAARSSDVPLMKLLLELGADPNLPNADQCSPLLAAAGVGALSDGEESAGTEEEAIAAVRLLLDAGADINAVDKNGETVMHGAAYQERPKLAQYLFDRGADIEIWNRKNRWGWTPLMTAQGHRPGNFRPSPFTIASIEKCMRAKGIEPPKAVRPPEREDWKNN